MLTLSASANKVGAIVDPERNHNTEANSQLLKGNQRATDFRWCDFGIVHGYDHREGPHTHTTTCGQNIRLELLKILT